MERQQTVRTRGRVGVAILIASLLLPVSGFLVTTRAGAALLMWVLEHSSTPKEPQELVGRVQAIVVVGGRTARIHEAARLHLATGVPLLLSGKGTGDSGFAAESEKMEDILLRRYGVGPRWVETESRDTHQNAVFSWCLASGTGVRSVALVTDPFHMPRARAEFEAAGFRVVAVPTQDAVVLSWRPKVTGTLADLEPGLAGWAAARRPVFEWGGTVAALFRGALLPRPSCREYRESARGGA